MAHGLNCSAACGIFLDRGLNPCPLHWQVDSQPLRHQGSPTVLKRSGERGHSCLVPDLSGKAWHFSPLNIMLAIGFFVDFISLRKFPSIFSLLRIFILNGCWDLPNAFPAVIDKIMQFFFQPVDGWITLIDYCVLS